MKTSNSFSLQKITLTLDALPDNQELERRIHEAKASYDWIYQNEGPHDVMVQILFPLYFTGVHGTTDAGAAA